MHYDINIRYWICMIYRKVCVGGIQIIGNGYLFEQINRPFETVEIWSEITINICWFGHQLNVTDS